jgi:hypothetical protein
MPKGNGDAQMQKLKAEYKILVSRQHPSKAKLPIPKLPIPKLPIPKLPIPTSSISSTTIF